MKRFLPLNGEKTLIEAPIHWKNYLSSGTLFLVFGILFAFLTIKNDCITNALTGKEIIQGDAAKILLGLELIFFGFIIMFAFGRAAKVACIRYYVTTERIISTNGFFTIKTKEMLIARCETVNIKQSVYERLFGCADILCQAPGSEIILDDVANADKFRKTILEQMSTYKRKQN